MQRAVQANSPSSDLPSTSTIRSWCQFLLRNCQRSSATLHKGGLMRHEPSRAQVFKTTGTTCHRCNVAELLSTRCASLASAVPAQSCQAMVCDMSCLRSTLLGSASLSQLRLTNQELAGMVICVLTFCKTTRAACCTALLIAPQCPAGTLFRSTSPGPSHTLHVQCLATEGFQGAHRHPDHR